VTADIDEGLSALGTSFENQEDTPEVLGADIGVINNQDIDLLEEVDGSQENECGQ
jgi:hypothetical protein